MPINYAECSLYSSLTFCWFAIIVGVAQPGMCAAEDPIALTRHEAALSSIQTLYCQVRIEYNPPQPGANLRADYWRVGNDVRCDSLSAANVSTRQLLKAGVLKYCNYDASNRPIDAGITPKNVPIAGDPWFYGLQSFSTDDLMGVPLRELLQSPSRSKNFFTKTELGIEYDCLDIAHKHFRSVIWFRHDRNGLVERIDYRSTGENPDVGVRKVESFSEIAPGVYFPKSIVTDIHRANGKTQGMRITIENFVLNQPLPPNTMELKFPQGVVIDDSVRDGLFSADAAGNAVLPVKSKQGDPLTRISELPSVAAETHAEFTEATRIEPTHWTDHAWIIAASMFVISALAVWFRRRF